MSWTMESMTSTSSSDFGDWFHDNHDQKIQNKPCVAYERKRRESVSSEPPKLDEYNHPIFPKSAEEMNRIIKILTNLSDNHFLFKNISIQRIKEIAESMEPITADKGHVIIKQGDQGDYFYLLDEGTVNVYKDDMSGNMKHINSIIPPESFGELALLHAAPRAATCIAETDCKLWRLCRISFQNLLISGNIKSHQRQEELLRSIPWIESLGDYQIMKLANATRSRNFQAGTVIMSTDSPLASNLYIVDQGSVKLARGNETIEIIGPGQFFGPFKNNDRGILITALTMCTLQCLGNTAIARIIGQSHNELRLSHANQPSPQN